MRAEQEKNKLATTDFAVWKIANLKEVPSDNRLGMK